MVTRSATRGQLSELWFSRLDLEARMFPRLRPAATQHKLLHLESCPRKSFGSPSPSILKKPGNRKSKGKFWSKRCSKRRAKKRFYGWFVAWDMVWTRKQ